MTYGSGASNVRLVGSSKASQSVGSARVGAGGRVQPSGICTVCRRKRCTLAPVSASTSPARCKRSLRLLWMAAN